MGFMELILRKGREKDNCDRRDGDEPTARPGGP